MYNDCVQLRDKRRDISRPQFYEKRQGSAFPFIIQPYTHDPPIEVQDQFPGGGGGGWGLLPEYFLQRLPENQVVLPEYYLLFPENHSHLKNSRGVAAPLVPIL